MVFKDMATIVKLDDCLKQRALQSYVVFSETANNGKSPRRKCQSRFEIWRGFFCFRAKQYAV